MTSSIVAPDDTRSEPPFGFRFVAPLALGSMLNPINSTMIATALVPIAAEFDAGVAESGWLIASLYLTSAIAQPMLGRMADLLGARRVYLFSLALVAVGGIVGHLVRSLDALIAVRVLLGIGTSGAYPAAMSLFRQRAEQAGSAPPRAAIGVLAMTGNATAAIGPLLGGLLTACFGWRAVFAVNLPLAALAALLVLLWVPKDKQPFRGSKLRLAELDMLGILLFGAALASSMLFLMKLKNPPWLALPIAAVLGGALVLHSRRRPMPFLDVRALVLNRPLTLSYVRAALIMMVLYCVLYGFAQWLESAAGFTAAQAGLVTLPMSVLAALSAVGSARVNGIRSLFVIGTASALAGCTALLFVHSATPVSLLVIAVLFFGLPQGMSMAATQATIYLQAPAAEIGTAAGLQRTAQYIGAIAAASLLGIVYGHHATDQGLHSLALVIGAISVGLLVWTTFDRTIPRSAA